MCIQGERCNRTILKPKIISIILFFFIAQVTMCQLGWAQNKQPVTVKTEAGELLFKQGLDAYRENDFVKSSSFFEQAIAELKGKDDYLDILSVAYLYLGRCAVIMNNEEKARDSFLNALNLNPRLSLDITTDPPKIVEHFELVNNEFQKEQEQKRLAQMEEKMTHEVTDPIKKKAWYKKWWVWGIGVAVVGAGVAAASSGGESEEETGGIHVTWSP